MSPTGYVCSTGYIYPVEHIVKLLHRIHPTGLKSLHRINPQDIVFYILWVNPVGVIFISCGEHILWVQVSFTDVV